jgi:hypothetical protein
LHCHTGQVPDWRGYITLRAIGLALVLFDRREQSEDRRLNLIREGEIRKLGGSEAQVKAPRCSRRVGSATEGQVTGKIPGKRLIKRYSRR